jgi:hypothetical protein
MALFLIERSFAEQLDLTGEDVRVIEDINADEGVNWLFSFLSADRRRSYCLYEAPSPDQIIAAAKRANVPVDQVVEVSKFQPELVRSDCGTISPDASIWRLILVPSAANAAESTDPSACSSPCDQACRQMRVSSLRVSALL